MIFECGFELERKDVKSAVRFDAQPEAVLNRMFVIYQLLPLALWTLAVVSVWFYPLTRLRSARIRTELEARRGAL